MRSVRFFGGLCRRHALMVFWTTLVLCAVSFPLSQCFSSSCYTYTGTNTDPECGCAWVATHGFDFGFTCPWNEAGGDESGSYGWSGEYWGTMCYLKLPLAQGNVTDPDPDDFAHSFADEGCSGSEEFEVYQSADCPTCTEAKVSASFSGVNTRAHVQAGALEFNEEEWVAGGSGSAECIQMEGSNTVSSDFMEEPVTECDVAYVTGTISGEGAEDTVPGPNDEGFSHDPGWVDGTSVTASWSVAQTATASGIDPKPTIGQEIAVVFGHSASNAGEIHVKGTCACFGTTAQDIHQTMPDP